MQIEIRVVGEWTQVDVRDGVSHAEAVELDQRLNAQIDQGARALLVQFDEQIAVNSAVLRLLVRVYKHLASRQGKLCIRCAASALWEVLQMAGIDTLLNCPDDAQSIQVM